MKTQRFLVFLTVVNLGILLFQLIHSRTAEAQNVVPVLRGRGLEIVDDSGRLRASITVMPGDPNFKMPDGTTGYTETVLFRLINSKGRPNVKIETTETGAAMGLVGETDPTGALINANGASSLLKLTNKDGRQQLIKP